VARPAFQVADVFRRHGEAYRQANAGHLDRCQRRVMGAIEACRTAALGGHVRQCRACGHKEISYASCRDRHCPTCQGSAARTWLEARQADLLPVEYFHVVFTLPQQIAAIAYQNKEVVTAFCSMPQPRRSRRLPAIPSTSAPRSDSPRSYILGVRR
jgi:hypothetical protein